MNLDVQLLRAVVVKLTQMLAQQGLKVTQLGMQAYVETDTRTGKPIRINIPNIPDNASEDLIFAIQGFIDHECSHALHTDFSQQNKAVALDKAAGHGSRDARGKFKPGPIATLWNIIEDPYIERRMREKFPGSEYNFDQTYKFFLARIIQPAVDAAVKKGEPRDLFLSLLVPMFRAWSGQKSFVTFLKPYMPMVDSFVSRIDPALIAKLPLIRSSAGSLALAIEFDKALNAKPPKPPEEKEECAGGDGEGEGKGKGTGKDKKKDKGEPKKEKPEKPGAGESEKKDDETGTEEGTEDETDEAAESGADEKEEMEDEHDDPASSDEGDEPRSEDEVAPRADDDDEERPDESAESDDAPADKGEADDEEEVADEGDGEGDDTSADAGGEGDEETDGDTRGEAAPGDEVEEDPMPWMDDMEERGLKSDDFDEAVSRAISKDVAEAAVDAEYLVYTRDGDVIEPFKVDEEHYRDRWMTELEDQTRGMVGVMQKEIERMMAARSQVLKVPGYRSGRIHAAGLHRLATGDDRVFRRKFDHKSREVAVELLIDNSGSMSGPKISLAMAAGFALSQTLERVGVTHEVLGFTTKSPGYDHKRMREEEASLGRRFTRYEGLLMPIYKGFDERLTANVKQRFAAAPHQHFLNQNVDGECVEIAALRLLTRRQPRKVLMVLSDGSPAAVTGDGDLHEHLRKTVEWCEKQKVETIGIGIMSRDVRSYYPKHIILSDLSALPGQVMAELRRILLS